MFYAVIVVLALLAPSVHGKTMFEGFYRIERKGVHTGYLIQRHSVDDKTKDHTIAYFVWRRDKETAPPVISGVRAVSREVVGGQGGAAQRIYEPKHYYLYEWLDRGLLVSHAVFDKELEIKSLRKDKLVATQSLKIPSGGFISTFVPLSLMVPNQNLSPNKRFTYDAISEESHKFHSGEVNVLKVSAAAEGTQVVQALNSFANEDLEYFLLQNGEVLGFRNPLADMTVFLVANREAGVGELKYPKEAVQKVFGDLPVGLTNPVSDSKGTLNARETIRSFSPGLATHRKPSEKPAAKKLNSREAK